jgi:MFS family permease
MRSLFIAASLAAICAGSVMGWTSHALPYLQKPTNIINGSDVFSYTVADSSAVLPNFSDVSVFVDNNGTVIEGVTDLEGSWIGSLAPLGALVGALPAGHVANVMGRKRLLLLLTVPYLIGWSLIIAAGKSVSHKRRQIRERYRRPHALLCFRGNGTDLLQFISYTSTSSIVANNTGFVV